MKSDRSGPVAIIGGGFSGTMVAAHLARRRIGCLLIEGGGRVGRGTAYSTLEPAHVLNVRAESMSAWPEDPTHFARYAASVGDADSGGFAKRRLFGRYLGDILDEAVESGFCCLVEDCGIEISRSGASWSVRLASGRQIDASAVVLAIGNQPPQPFKVAGDRPDRFIANPWGAKAKAAIEEAAGGQADVLILGTGLTMVDTVLSLRSAGHRASIRALSRRGLVPHGHVERQPAPLAAEDVPLGNLKALWRWIRGRAQEMDWRAAVDSLRPHSHRIWQSLDGEEQDRFLRHARPWWDVHRHRIAPEVAQQITELMDEGRLTVIAGRSRAIETDQGGVTVRYLPRGSKTEAQLRGAFAFNCTGPLGSIARTDDPLLQSLLRSPWASTDRLGIGLEVDDRSRVQGTNRLWALGPLTKGRYWEIIAVPDIRVQAADVAADIEREFSR